MRPKAAETIRGRLIREDRPRAYWEGVMQQWIFCAADRRMLAAYHFEGETQEAIAEAEALSVILWSVDPCDWDPKNKGSIVSSVVKKVQPGAIILMHDLYDHSVTAAAEIVDRLQKEGYEFRTVSELAEFYGAELLPGGVYGNFPASS